MIYKTLTVNPDGSLASPGNFFGANSTALKSDAGLDNIDNTADADKPLSTAMQAALDEKAPLVSRPQRADTYLVRDHFIGQNVFTASAQTRQCYPGPGTMTVSLQPSGSRLDISRGLYLMPQPTGAGPSVHWGSRTASAGLIIVAKTYFPTRDETGSIADNSQMFIGFSHNGQNTLRRGGILLMKDSVGNLMVCFSKLDTLSSESQLAALGATLTPGERVAVAVRYDTLTQQSYWLQADCLTAMGCGVDGGNWYPLGTTHADLTGQTVYPFVGSQFVGTSVVESVEVLSEWSPGNSWQFDYTLGAVGIHVPSIERDPVSGRLAMIWNKGSSHIADADYSARVSVQLADGSWTPPVDLGHADATYAWVVGTLGIINGQLYFIACKNALGVDGGQLVRFPLTINAGTGAVTVGAEQGFSGMSTEEKLAFCRPVTLQSGRTLMPYHAADGATVYSKVAISDDQGATWSVVDVPQAAGVGFQAEPTLAVESDGAVGMYIRTDQYVAFYSRSTDSGSTWSTPVAVNGVACPRDGTYKGGRMMTRPLPNGDVLLIANDHRVVRKEVTIFTMGVGGVIKGSRVLLPLRSRLNDISSPNYVAQYPDIYFDAVKQTLLVAYSREDASTTGGAGNTSICAVEIPWTGTTLDYPDAPNLTRTILPGETILGGRLIPAAHAVTFASTISPDARWGNVLHCTLTGNVTINAPSYPLPWQTITFVLVQDSTGSRLLTLGTGWRSGLPAPTLQTAANAVDYIRAIYNPLVATWDIIP